MEPRLPRFFACELRPTSKRMFGLALACAAIGAAFSCESDKKPERKPAKTTARNVVLILIDTLRADKLGCYGNTLGLTPNIDQIASEGFRFDQAFSHAPWTLPATASLLTSSYPQQHGAGGSIPHRKSEFDFTAVSPKARTLAQCFYDQGYDTAAIVNVTFLDKKYGLNAGFETYDFQAPDRSQKDHRRAAEVTNWALKWIEDHQKSDRPFFLLVHYFDPHLSYDPPEKFRRKFAKPEDYKPDPTLFGSVSDMLEFRAGSYPISKIPIDRLEALYNGEVAYTDEEVGRLWNKIKDMGLGERTVLALTADHGEEFLDHDGFEHGHTLYDEMIRVPLVLWAPGLIKAGESKSTVAHVDVAPTLCSLSSVDPEPSFRGKSLERWMYGGYSKNQPIFSQGNLWGPILTALRDHGHKFIDKRIGREMYDIVNDPKEKRNLVKETQFISLVEEMNKEVESLKLLLGSEIGTKVKLTQTDIDQLKGGGYWLEGMDEKDESSTTMPATRPSNNN